MENAPTRSHSSSSSFSLISSEELISGIDDDIKQDAAAVVPPPKSPAEERNASDSAPGPRLSSLTELLMISQKAAAKGNSTPSSDMSPPSTARCFSTSTLSSSDQTPSPVWTSRSDEKGATPEMMSRRAGSSGGGGAHRRLVAPAAVTLSSADSSASGGGGGGVVVADADLRRFVFHRSRAKRLVSGLRVHAFTRQAFVSSFTVGLALGSVVAIALKILRDFTHRMLYG